LNRIPAEVIVYITGFGSGRSTQWKVEFDEADFPHALARQPVILKNTYQASPYKRQLSTKRIYG